MSHPIKHFLTVTHHRHLVLRLCCRVGVPWRGLVHDLSKYSPIEFVPGARYYTGTCSPIGAEKKARGYSSAWLHHKGLNRHHFEYWMYYSSLTFRYEYIRMPIPYLKEMFCDRVAASMIYYKDKYTNSIPLDFYTERRDGEGMHPDTAALLHSWLCVLAEQGDAVYDIIKKTKCYPAEDGDGVKGTAKA